MKTRIDRLRGRRTYANVTATLALFTALGGTVLHVINGGNKTTNAARGLVAALHGIALEPARSAPCAR